jgi:uncharacterized membrane protein
MKGNFCSQMVWGILGYSCVLVSISGAASFQGLGFLPGGNNSEARAVSADGSAVVGSSNTATTQQGYCWTASGGMIPLPRPEGLAMCWAGDISADGRTVSGWGGNSFGTSAGWEGIRWMDGAISDRLTLAGGAVFTHAISGDGNRIVGTRTVVVNNKPMDRAFVWTPEGGFFDLGVFFNADLRTTATGISQDGRVILGDCISDALSTRTVFTWTAEGGVVPMGDIFSADELSRDGSVIVGTMLSPSIFQAYRWTAADGVVPIPTPGQNNQSRAQAVSGDGSIVVGYVEYPDETRSAFMWDQTHGTRYVKDVLESEFGLNLAGWTLLVAWNISDDGTTIVGRGRNPQGFEEAWRAVMPNRTPVVFADANLRAAVEAALGVSDPTVDNMKRLTQLEARSRKITNLAGLETAFHLKKLELKDNQIEDISALGNLTELEVLDLGRNRVVVVSLLGGLANLMELDLDGNQIGDIYPLTRLTQLDELELQGNPLNRGAYCRDLQTIRDNNPQITLTYDDNPSSLEGDFNRDCAVDLDDLMILAGEWLKSDCDSCKADADGDGVVSMPDFEELSENWRG